jgi:hypothetical protein
MLTAQTSDINVDAITLWFPIVGIKREARLMLVLLIVLRNYVSLQETSSVQNDPFCQKL